MSSPNGRGTGDPWESGGQGREASAEAQEPPARGDLLEEPSAWTSFSHLPGKTSQEPLARADVGWGGGAPSSSVLSLAVPECAYHLQKVHNHLALRRCFGTGRARPGSWGARE